MPNTESQLFTVEEALVRLGQNRFQGCLMVSKAQELVQIYVQDGYVVHASGGVKKGMEAVDQALHLVDATYSWMRGIQPPSSDIRLNIQEFVITHGNINKPKITETNKLKQDGIKQSKEPQYKYFLVPKDEPTVKLYLTKAATVLGRDRSSDLPIDHVDVSRRHCLLDIQPRGLFVLDLDSTNGTFVNGILTTDGYLSPGDTIELGAYMLVVNREAITPGPSR